MATASLSSDGFLVIDLTLQPSTTVSRLSSDLDVEPDRGEVCAKGLKPLQPGMECDY